MARITVEDCIVHVPNRFELVILAAERAKDLFAGAPSLFLGNTSSSSTPGSATFGNKPPIAALREIAAGVINIDNLRKAQITHLQKNNKFEEGVEENLYAETQEGSLESDYAAIANEKIFDGSQEFDIHSDVDFSDDNVIDED